VNEVARFLHEISLPDQVVVSTLVGLIVGGGGGGGFTNKHLLK
jgi:hypothetical protein